MQRKGNSVRGYSPNDFGNDFTCRWLVGRRYAGLQLRLERRDGSDAGGVLLQVPALQSAAAVLGGQSRGPAQVPVYTG